MKAKIYFVLLACLFCSAANPDGAASINWGTDINGGLKQAGLEHKLIYLDFYAAWCPPCRKMDRVTYSDERVIARLNQLVPIRIDVDENPTLAKAFNGKPGNYSGSRARATVIINSDGKILFRQHGLLMPDELLEVFENMDED